MTTEEIIDRMHEGKPLAAPGGRSDAVNRLAHIMAVRHCESLETVWKQVEPSMRATFHDEGEFEQAKDKFEYRFNRSRHRDEVAFLRRRIGPKGLVIQIAGPQGSGKSTIARAALDSLPEKSWPVVCVEEQTVYLYLADGKLVTDIGLEHREAYLNAKTLILVEQS